MARLATFNDVAARFEDLMPAEKQDWVELRIEDVENELIGLVPTLVVDISLLDAARVGRVRRLICDKVLALFRNPDGALTIATEFGPERESRTLPGSRVVATSWVSFTADELASVGGVTNTGSAGSVILRAYG